MGTFIHSFGHLIKRPLAAGLRKWHIALRVLAGRSAVGAIIEPKGKNYITFEYYKDLSLAEAMTLVVELKRKVSYLEAHIDTAAQIKGERATLEALKKTMDVTVGETPTVVGE